MWSRIRPNSLYTHRQYAAVIQEAIVLGIPDCIGTAIGCIDALEAQIATTLTWCQSIALDLASLAFVAVGVLVSAYVPAASIVLLLPRNANVSIALGPGMGLTWSATCALNPPV